MGRKKKSEREKLSWRMDEVMRHLEGGKIRVRFYPSMQQTSDVHCPIIGPKPEAMADMLGGFSVVHTRRATLSGLVRRKLVVHHRVQLTTELSCEEWTLP